MEDMNKEPKELIDKLQEEKFYGDISFKFKRGVIVHAEEVKSHIFNKDVKF